MKRTVVEVHPETVRPLLLFLPLRLPSCLMSLTGFHRLLQFPCPSSPHLPPTHACLFFPVRAAEAKGGVGSPGVIEEGGSGWCGIGGCQGQCCVHHLQEEAEIPAKAFQKAPEPLGPADQAAEPGPQQPEGEGGESSDEEEPVESRALRLRRAGLVHSLRRAFSGRKGPAAPTPTPVKPPRLGPGRSPEGQPEAQPESESKQEPEPPQETEEDPGRPGAAEAAAAVLQIESAA